MWSLHVGVEGFQFYLWFKGDFECCKNYALLNVKGLNTQKVGDHGVGIIWEYQPCGSWQANMFQLSAVS